MRNLHKMKCSYRNNPITMEEHNLNEDANRNLMTRVFVCTHQSNIIYTGQCGTALILNYFVGLPYNARGFT